MFCPVYVNGNDGLSLGGASCRDYTSSMGSYFSQANEHHVQQLIPGSKEEAEEKFGRNAHLARFWNELTSDERRSLVRQFESIDVADAEECFQISGHPKELEVIQGIDDDHYAVAYKFDKESLTSFWRKGLEAIAEGKVAAVVLAGGQATRLGAAHPKGTLDLGLKDESENKMEEETLLGLQAARIARLQNLAKDEFPGSNAVIQWVVMTSDSTDRDTLDHLKNIVPKHGLSMEQVILFEQGELPCFDSEGKMILSDKSKIAVSPDGNGGLYKAIAPHLGKLRNRGVRYLHVYCVDNILCRVADPHFVGFCIMKDADCAAKAVEKVDPHEAVGVICRDQEKVKVVEYSEISKELAEKRDQSGLLMLRAGNIANHYFTLDFLDRVCVKECRLFYHRAQKKIPYIDNNGQVVTPVRPNGIKLEQFVFDVFEYSRNFYVWEVSRQTEFSPLKNSEKVKKDCLSTCRRDLSAECRRWLERAGATLKGDKMVFIHPSRSYMGEALEEFKGSVLETPFVLK